LGSGLPRFPQNYTCFVVLRILERVHNLSSTGLSPSLVGFPKTIPLDYAFVTPYIKSYNPHAVNRHRFGLLRFRSPLLTESISFSFPPGNKMFQFPGYRSHFWVVRVYLTGFSHSEINGSMLVYSSPSLIAANHVLLRLLVPWHPPYALSYLTILSLYHYLK
jgi:hypothetical protein